VSASVKTSKESQSEEERNKSSTHSREAMTFEATGGNTILAAE